jgi:hypothetical protein
MIDRSKVVGKIHINNRLDFIFVKMLMQGSDGIVAPHAWPKKEGDLGHLLDKSAAAHCKLNTALL